MRRLSTHAAAGERLMQQGQLKEAAAKFAAGLAKDAVDLECLLGLARIHLARNEGEAARPFLQKLRAQVPGHAEANSHLLRLDAQGGDLVALAKLRALSARKGAGFFEHLNLGRALLSQRAFAEAASAFVRAGKLQPKSADVFLYLGMTVEAQGQLAEAGKAFRRAAVLAPKEHAPLVLGARVLLEQHQPSRAIPLFEQAIALSPNDLTLYGELARLCIGVEAWPRALSAARELRKRQKDSAEGAYLEGLVCLLTGKADAAEKLLAEARKLAPGSLEPLIALARLKLLLKDEKAAEKILEDAVSRFPAAADPAKDLAMLWLQQPGKPKQARARTVLAAAAAANPEDLGLQLDLALAWADADKPRARRHAQTAARSPVVEVSTQAVKLVEALR